MRNRTISDTGRNEFIQECTRLFASVLQSLGLPEQKKLQAFADAIYQHPEASRILADMAAFIQQLLTRVPQAHRQEVFNPLNDAIDRMITYYTGLPRDTEMPAEWVDLFSWYANHNHSPQTLLQIHSWMDQLIKTREEEYLARLMLSDPASPWRIQLFNLAIVATRTHEPELIRSAYARIARLLPRESMEFFAQAMEQMDLIGYPDAVRKVVQEFYQRNQPYNTRH